MYLLYTADFPSLFAKHLATGHLYADDVQTFVHGSPADQVVLVGLIDSLSYDLHAWMSANRLCLNPTKMQLIWFGTKQQLLKLNFPLLSSMYPDFTVSSSVRDLGVTLDSPLSFSDHLSRSYYYHLRRLRAIRRSVSSSVFKTIVFVHAFICCRID